MYKDYQLPPLRIAVSGASGLVGRELCSLLTTAGHHVVRLVRDIAQATTASDANAEPSPSEQWKRSSDYSEAVAPWHGAAQVRRLEGIDAVIHLAGQSIAERRWSLAVKQEINDSRVMKTRQLCQALASLDRPPRALLSASAIGIYGDRPDEVLTESSPPGDGFLPDVARQWEAACHSASDAGIRVANLRLGIILSARGGALQKMLLPAKLGIGGPLGSGRQWWSWVDITDTTAAIYHILATDALEGPINVVAPNAVRQAAFATALGTALHRPAVIPTPAFALRLALGEMADPLLLASARVEPLKLLESGFNFRFGRLPESLQHQLG